MFSFFHRPPPLLFYLANNSRDNLLYYHSPLLVIVWTVVGLSISEWIFAPAWMYMYQISVKRVKGDETRPAHISTLWVWSEINQILLRYTTPKREAYKDNIFKEFCWLTRVKKRSFTMVLITNHEFVKITTLNFLTLRSTQFREVKSRDNYLMVEWDAKKFLSCPTSNTSV
jgi:hypothetical protein